TTTATVQGGTVNATTALQLGGNDINTAGNLRQVGFLNQANSFSAKQTISASTTGLALSGTPVAGTGITSLVQLGSAIVGGNSSLNGGTYLGLNEPSSGAGSA